jgi:hypothetical protein
MQDQDVVYANLAGEMARQARAIIDTMHATGLKRLIFVSSWVSMARCPVKHIAASLILTGIPPP